MTLVFLICFRIIEISASFYLLSGMGLVVYLFISNLIHTVIQSVYAIDNFPSHIIYSLFVLVTIILHIYVIYMTFSLTYLIIYLVISGFVHKILLELSKSDHTIKLPSGHVVAIDITTGTKINMFTLAMGVSLNWPLLLCVG